MLKIVRSVGKAAAALSIAFMTIGSQPALASEAEAATAALSVATVSRGSIDLSLDTALTSSSVRPAVVASAFAPATPAPAAPAVEAAPAPAPERRSLAELVRSHSETTPRDAQADCLAAAVYHESKGEPLAGQLAVAEVIINRARSGRFAPTLCGVVTQRSQFSFVRAGRIPTPPRDASWRTAVAVAHIALDDLADSPVANALFFHARFVSPRWRLQRLSAVGNHIFYR